MHGKSMGRSYRFFCVLERGSATLPLISREKPLFSGVFKPSFCQFFVSISAMVALGITTKCPKE
jgi:hypothetical protein